MTVNTDRELLKLILNGLLSNAILHGSRRGGQIKLTIAKSDVSQSGLIITVSDSGPGIPAANLPTIFDGVAGVRGKNKMKMGLHICKMAADILGAKLEIQPNTPSGIVAKLSIP